MRAENARFRGDGKAKAPSLPAEHLSIGEGKGFYIDYTPPPLDTLFKRDAALRGLTLDSGDHLMETLQLPDGARVVGFYREQALLFPDAQTHFQVGDEL